MVKKTVDKSDLFWKARSRVFRVIPARCWKGTPLDHLIWRRINDLETPLLWVVVTFGLLCSSGCDHKRYEPKQFFTYFTRDFISCVQRSFLCRLQHLHSRLFCQMSKNWETDLFLFFRPVVAKITQIVARLWGLCFLTDKELTCSTNQIVYWW